MESPIYAADLMSTHVITVDKKVKFSEVKKKMEEHNIHHMPVVEGPKLVGIISIKDMMQHSLLDPARTEIENLANLDQKVSIESVMHDSINAVFPNTPIQEAAEALFMSDFNCLPVCDQDKNLFGILTSKDFVRFVKDYFQAE